jgi:ribosomal protein S18 acetylase RimI-like enzyme
MTAAQGPSGCTIRRARAEEADAIADLHTASWRVTYRGILPEDTCAPAFIAERRAYWRAAVARAGWNIILVAEADRVPVAEDRAEDRTDTPDLIGFVAAWNDPDGRADAFIQSLHVRPGRTRGGIGRALVAAAASRIAASGRRSVTLWVYDANAAAKQFYLGIGGSVAEMRARERAGQTIRDVRMIWPDADALAAACVPAS